VTALAFVQSGAFRHVFESVLQRCMTEGLVGGEAIDWNAPGHATRAVSEYLAGLEENGAPVTVPASISMTDPGAR
jgi:hypothetical protein